MFAHHEVRRPRASCLEFSENQAFQELSISTHSIDSQIGRKIRLLLTSLAVTCNPSQSIRGVMLRMKSASKSSSCNSSSASRKWSGKDAGDVLQLLTAQVIKLAVITFIMFKWKGLKRQKEEKVWRQGNKRQSEVCTLRIMSHEGRVSHDGKIDILGPYPR